MKLILTIIVFVGLKVWEIVSWPFIKIWHMSNRLTENWLNTFNHAESRRHNESQSLIKNILSWLGVSNKEEQRHNLTQSKIGNIFAELGNTNDLCNNL